MPPHDVEEQDESPTASEEGRGLSRGIIGVGIVLWLVGCGLVHPVTESGPLWRHLALLPLALGLAWIAWRIAGRDDHPSVIDPIERLRGRRKTLISALAFFVLAANFIYVDVLWCGDTTVSVPYLNIKNDEAKPASGLGYLVDPFAGFILEGPALFLTHDALSRGEVPLWNHREACGAPYLANGELAALSVVQAPLHARPSMFAWDLYVVVRATLAAFLAFLFLFGLGCGGRGALAGGVIFAFGGGFALHANLVHLNGALLTPLILLLGEAMIRRPTWRRFAGLAVCYGLALNGGNPQPTVVATAALGVRLLIAITAWRRGLLVAGAAIVGALLTAVTLLPLVDLFGKSYNRTLTIVNIVLEPGALLNAAVPFRSDETVATAVVLEPFWWSIGILGSLLVATGILRALWRRDRAVLVWLPSLLFLVAPLVTEFGAEWIGRRLPVLSSVAWIKYVTTTQLLGALFAARVLERLSGGESLRIPALLAAGIAGGAAFWFRDTPSATTLQVAVIVGGAVAFGALALFFRRGRPFPVVAAMLTVFLVGELGVWIPDHPIRPEPYRQRPASREFLDAHHKEARGAGMPWRTTALADTFPPLTSSVLGWYDVRSVSPVVLERYHRWLAPYSNCGAWPALPAPRCVTRNSHVAVRRPRGREVGRLQGTRKDRQQPYSLGRRSSADSLGGSQALHRLRDRHLRRPARTGRSPGAVRDRGGRIHGIRRPSPREFGGARVSRDVRHRRRFSRPNPSRR